MKYEEKEHLPYNRKTDEHEEKTGTVELSPFSIEGTTYNIPPKIFNKSFLLKTICMFYRSDEHKIILTQERSEYPQILTESTEKVYNYDHDQFLQSVKMSKTGKGYVRVSLYEVGKPNPIKIDKFKPWRILHGSNKEEPEWWYTFGCNFTLKAGNYFLLFDNIDIDVNEFNKYESLTEANNAFKWWGSDSFGPSFYLDNGMWVFPFRIYETM